MASAHNKFISNEQAIPVIETDVFADSPDAILGLMRLNADDVLAGSNSLALGYSQFRANVYIDQTRMLDESCRQPDGGERDEDDHRSMHFVGLENRGNGKAAVVTAMRMIHKTEDFPELLPIEYMYADELGGTVFPNGSYEVSRFISKNAIRQRQILTKSAVIASGLAYAIRHNWDPCLAVVESPVAESLSSSGVPVNALTQPKLLAEYNDENMAIEIDQQELLSRLGMSAVNLLYIEDGELKVIWRTSDERS